MAGELRLQSIFFFLCIFVVISFLQQNPPLRLARGNVSDNERMTAWIIILGALWTYPIITLGLIWYTKKRPALRKKIILISIILTLLATFGLITNISTTFSELDWLIVTSIYLTVSLLLWLIFFNKNKVVKVIGIVFLIAVFGLGYFSGTIGALGVGFVTAEYATDYEQWFEKGIIYKETSLGNALSDHRGKRVEIYKTIPWFPVVEWRTNHKEYNNLIVYGTRLTVDYRKEESKFYLSATKEWGKDRELLTWADTLTLNKNHYR